MLNNSRSMKETIIKEVAARSLAKWEPAQGEMCSRFVERFYGTVSLNDLEQRSIEDLCGSSLSFWNFIAQRSAEEIKLRIYNPDYERHGWQSTHTIIEILHTDMPFLVDSISMAINRLGLTVHLIIHLGGLAVKRDKNGQLEDFKINGAEGVAGYKSEAPIYLEVNRQTDPVMLETIKQTLYSVLADVRAAVQDWQAMRQWISASIDHLKQVKKHFEPADFKETVDLLSWLKDNHFTFLGAIEYNLQEENDSLQLQAVFETGLGILGKSRAGEAPVDLLPKTLDLQAQKNSILTISKTDQLSTVHRPIHMDLIVITRRQANGELSGVVVFVGCYTHVAYHANPMDIPFVRRNVAQVISKSGFSAAGHAGKELLNILEALPRDDLFQATPDELLDIAMGILQIQERRMIRLFARKDAYSRFISALVFVPRERFNTELRREMEKVLLKEFHGQQISFATRFSESVLARIHFVIKVNPCDEHTVDFRDIEKKLVEVARSWEDDLRTHILEVFGEEAGNILANQYGNAFSASYREYFSSRTAVYDIRHIEALNAANTLEMNFYRPVDAADNALRFKIYQLDYTIALSDVLPILENMGLHVISERPYEIKRHDGRSIWINDFSMTHTRGAALELDEVKEIFQDAFAKIWFGHAENDGFNKLLLGAGVTWYEVSMLRAYAKYLRQVRFTFSQEYIESTLVNNAIIAKNLVGLFQVRFCPLENVSRQPTISQIESEIISRLDQVVNLDEDRILRRYLDVIRATLRTSYFQVNAEGQPKSYIALKLDPRQIPDMPLPLPMFEIFVYSPRFEGVHLRSGKVARGGLRWSDRREDFRTEILGLMKAQVVKNAVIVPGGAKGGFVPKALPDGDRDAILQEAKTCYQSFIRGLLDITDNLKDARIEKPVDTICYDEDDPYLVVAADKGTATFSDIANAIAEEYNFWLGDAFASGGSAGYDHKKMGITAKGAWESVKRHFRELGKNIQEEAFTVVGVGDMAGDVFGNGMLLSEHIKLVAAFNHMHIFIDPEPDCAVSFKERKRLFELPRSSWSDYSADLISKGGGVFNRSAKSIKLSAEAQKVLALHQDVIVPNELIQAILRAPVDLLWNGGIGTYVKSPQETHDNVGDRANDNTRINSDELRCKVVGEGGNLGFTQLARVDYAISGGMIYSDFIDNSAGVDCSDHEVNIKILLNKVVSDGDMTVKQRNQLLADMTDEVAEHVLYNNYEQTQAISLAAVQAATDIELHSRYIEELERTGKLERALEFLPDEKALLERKLVGKGLSRPGIGILLAYSKILVKEAILASDVPEDPYLVILLQEAFPKPLRHQFGTAMQAHSLKREIIATQLSNAMFNEMGFTFVYRLQDEVGASIPAIACAYTVARAIFDLPTVWRVIESLDNKVSTEDQVSMFMPLIRLIRRSTRWILRTQRSNLNIARTIKAYEGGVSELKKYLPEVLSASDKVYFDSIMQRYTSIGLPEGLAKKLASTRSLFSALDIISAAEKLSMGIKEVAQIYYAIGERLDINWLRGEVIANLPDNHWDALSREALRDDLDWQQRALTVSIAKHQSKTKDMLKRIDDWEATYIVLIERWRKLLADLRSLSSLNMTMYFVAIRELLDLTQTSVQQAKK